MVESVSFHPRRRRAAASAAIAGSSEVRLHGPVAMADTFKALDADSGTPANLVTAPAEEAASRALASRNFCRICAWRSAVERVES